MTRRIGFLYCMMAFGALLLLPFIAAAQEDPVMDEQQPKHEWPRMKVEELKQLIDTKATDKIVIVDNAPKEAFDEGHVPGAVNLPWSERLKPPITLPRNKTLVMYCPCTHEEDSTDMADKLRQFGYFNIKLLDGGWFKWEEMKYPVEKSK